MKGIKPYRIAITIVIVLLIILSSKSCSKLRQYERVMNSLNDSLLLTTNKNDEQVAKISVIETQKAKQFLAIESKDSIIISLQTLVADYKSKLAKGGSATILTTNTKVDTMFETTTIVHRDTVKKDSVIYIYPEYQSNLQLGKWIAANVSANRDTTTLDLSVENEYSILIGKDRNGLFKKRVPFVEVTNHNPYTKTKTLRTYQVEYPKPKRLGIGVSAGYALTSDLKFQPYIGIGINYNLIEIR